MVVHISGVMDGLPANGEARALLGVAGVATPKIPEDGRVLTARQKPSCCLRTGAAVKAITLHPGGSLGAGVETFSGEIPQTL